MTFIRAPLDCIRDVSIVDIKKPVYLLSDRLWFAIDVFLKQDEHTGRGNMPEPAQQVSSVSTLFEVKRVIREAGNKRDVIAVEITEPYFVTVVGNCPFDRIAQQHHQFSFRRIGLQALRHVGVDEVGWRDLADQAPRTVLGKLLLIPLISSPKMIREEIELFELAQRDLRVIEQDIVEPGRRTFLDTDTYEQLSFHDLITIIRN